MARSLEKLFSELCRRAKALHQAGSDKWAHRQLPQGAVVAVRVWPKASTDRLELRIARKAKEGGERWERELQVFLDGFGLVQTRGRTPCEMRGEWWRHEDEEHEPDEDGRRVFAARFLELRIAEVKPGRAMCWDCHEEEGTYTELPWGPFGPRRHRCNPHGIAHGKAVLGAAKEE